LGLRKLRGCYQRPHGNYKRVRAMAAQVASISVVK
jgi:hypothetical protein